MDIRRVDVENKADWNRFVRQHYPPVGAFMQTWEWGTFQKNLGREVVRYVATDRGETVALFALVRHPLPMNFSYGYIPRGPVIASHAMGEADALRIFTSLQDWIQREPIPGLVFLRMEPPVSSLASDVGQRGFVAPPYYVQPRYNHTIVLEGDERAIVQSFHPSTRSNISRAERRGVTAELKHTVTEKDWDSFFSMARETIERNSGKNVYPQRPYFDALIRSIPLVTDSHDPERLSLGVFFAYEHGAPAAINFVLFFGDTATYLYGASHSNALRSKATTYLHWTAMREAKKMGLKYYDLGGVDEARWPTLTDFKRQFRGKEFSYAGNIDIPVRPMLYRIYNLARRLKGL